MPSAVRQTLITTAVATVCALVVALVLTWLSGLDYARAAPSLLRGRAVA